MTRPTVHDIAKLVGVSPSTVSRALGAAPERVAEETRIRIQDAAHRLGYGPNLAARQLVTGRWDSIGFLVPDIQNPYFAAILKGIQSEARRWGSSVYVADFDEDPSAEAEIALGLSKKVDALVLCSSRMGDDDIRHVEAEVPVVLVNRQLTGLPSVACDEARIMRLAVEHLYALGHRKIAYLRGPDSSWTNGRRRAALEVLQRERADLTIVEFGPLNPVFNSGMTAADLVLAAQASALVACNDLVAMGAMARLRQRGVDVPRDMSVIGVDDSASARMARPGLTSVHTPDVTLGRRAAVATLNHLRGAAPCDLVEDADIELMLRDSTGVLSTTTL